MTADGRRLLVVHGDLFDGVIQCAKWLAIVGDRLYMLALHLNRWFNAARARLGFPCWSLSQFLKHKVKNAVSYITDFEIALAQEARRRGVDGVVCGHIHKAEIRSIGGVLYCNDGDWVESLTALVECEVMSSRLSARTAFAVSHAQRIRRFVSRSIRFRALPISPIDSSQMPCTSRPKDLWAKPRVSSASASSSPSPPPITRAPRVRARANSPACASHLRLVAPVSRAGQGRDGCHASNPF